MAQWLQSQLRVAEGLLEAVDRTAKVVKETNVAGVEVHGDLPARPGSPVPGANGPTPQALSSGGGPIKVTTEHAQPTPQAAVAAPDGDVPASTLLTGPGGDAPACSTVTTLPALAVPTKAGGDGVGTASEDTDSLGNATSKGRGAAGAAPESKVVIPEPPATSDGNGISRPAAVPMLSIPGSDSMHEVPPLPGLSPYPASKEAVRRVIQLELDEARRMTDDTVGQAVTAREARLQRLVERLRERLEQYKAENTQLEELLQQADARYHGGAGAIEALREELARSEAGRTSAEAALAAASAAKEAEIVRLNGALAATREQVAGLQAEVAALQAGQALLREQHEEDEAALLRSLRAEVVALESRCAAECDAHSATRRDGEARVHALEAMLADSAADLAVAGRAVEERAAALEVARAEADGLRAELEAVKAEREAGGSEGGGPYSRAENGSSSQEAAALRSQCDFFRGELTRAQEARDAAETEAAGLAQQVEELRQQLPEASTSVELEARLKEVSELLYVKQTQLERLAADKAAMQMALERQVAVAQEEAAKAHRRGGARRSNGIGGGVAEEVVPMDSLPAYYRLAENKRVGRAVQVSARYLDMGTSRVVSLLKQHPLARVVVLLYAIFIHLYCYLLLQRLQRHAMSMEHHDLLRELHGTAAANAHR